MPADLQQNILVTLYFTVLHNIVAIFYFVGLITTSVWAIYKPSRPLVLALLGFAFLLFGFEYSKHLIEDFRDQTLTSVITEQPHYKAQRLINLFFNKAVPLGAPLVGWTCLGGSLIMGLRNFFYKKSHSSKE